MKINKSKLEINKPSELTQTVFFKNDSCNAVASLSAIQMDIFNLIFYKSKEYFIKNKVELTEFIPFEMELAVFASEFGKYQVQDYNNLVKQLVMLSDVKVVINALGKNKDMKTTFTRFIHKISVSRHSEDKRKKVRLVLDGDICKMIFDVKKLFTKFYLKIQFSMVSKYSKLLYELLKDYSGIKTTTIDYELLIALLNVDYENTNNGKWAMFNQNILRNAVKEINEKSDIEVSYEPIKEKPSKNKRLQVTKIKFNIEKQSEERLQELGLIQPSIVTLPFYNKSKAKLDKLVKGGYNVVDEEMWIETDIKKNEESYSFEEKLDNWTSKVEQEMKNKILQAVAEKIEDCYDPAVCIRDYRLVGVFSNEIFTRNAKETAAIINETVDFIGEFEGTDHELFED